MRVIDISILILLFDIMCAAIAGTLALTHYAHLSKRIVEIEDTPTKLLDNNIESVESIENKAQDTTETKFDLETKSVRCLLFGLIAVFTSLFASILYMIGNVIEYQMIISFCIALSVILLLSYSIIGLILRQHRLALNMEVLSEKVKQVVESKE